MEMTHYFESLGARLDTSIATVRAAADEDRQQLEERIDKAQADTRAALDKTELKADQAASEARDRWSQLKVGATAKTAEVKTKINRRGDEIDAEVAKFDADMAEADALEAIDFAGWAIDNAQLTALYALESRARADQLSQKVHA
jgi:hypothetical protein